eukprot:jgi/Mesen1/3394/ME000192S02559
MQDPVYSKLDILLERAKAYSNFLYEQMENVKLQARKKTRGAAAPPAAAAAGRAAAAAAAPAPGGDAAAEVPEGMTEEEALLREQRELAPILTGGALKGYQIKGVKWMISLFQNGLNGILADQMGLGKTVQTIGFLAHLISNRMHGPYLVVAPLSTLPNWINERAELRARHLASFEKKEAIPIIVTSFEIIMNDRKVLQRINWKYIVVDENTNCKLIRELRQLPAENTLLLTGTPLQNNLQELWSLLNFILPQVFTSLAEFNAWFDIGGKQRANDSSQDLIDKEKHSQDRGELARTALAGHASPVHFFGVLVAVAVLTDLRLDCVSLYPPVDELVGQCGKMQLLDRLLPRLKARGHKVLIFSQMTRLLDVLDYYLQERGYASFRIDGSIKTFQENTDEGFCFLLSTRAGGLGINLTAADTVIIYDSDWNPHQDMQAMDRCHRIGQTKPVHVYRLATAHSVEGRMLQVATGKLNLEHIVIEKGQFQHDKPSAGAAASGAAAKTTLEESELLALLKPQQNEQEEYIQSAEISDENLEVLLDRSDMVLDENNKPAAVPNLPPAGPGWVVITHGDKQGSILSEIS